MPRVYLPLLPLPVLAVVVAFSACGSRGEPGAHLIPPAAALTPAPALAAPPPTPQPPTGENAPSDEEVRAFERPVAK
jgi:hypothetical protein